MNIQTTIGLIIISVMLLNSIITFASGAGLCISDSTTCKPFAINVMGAFLSIDKNIGSGVDGIINNHELVEYYRYKILLNLALLIIVFVFLYKLGKWLAGTQQMEPLIQILIIIGIIGMYVIISSLFTWFTQGQYIPFEGIFNLIKNIKILI